MTDETNQNAENNKKPDENEQQTTNSSLESPTMPLSVDEQTLTQPTFEAQKPVVEKTVTISAGQLILQWLTYAFWGWTVLALSGLTASVIASFIGNSDTGGFTPYAIAAVLVLLPISYVTDFFYSKNEQEKKTGISMAIMVIHAVLFALIGIGSLILGVVMLVSIFTSAGDSNGAQITLYSSLIITFFYLATFLRTLSPARFPFIKRTYKLFMLVTVGVIALLGIVGPVAKERKLRNDKLVVASISTIQRGINDYARAKNELPDSLEEVNLKGDAQKIVDQNLVTYKQIGKSTDKKSSSYQSYSTVYKYELCVTYTNKSSGYDNSYNGSSYIDDDYSTSIYAYSHPAGEVCYKLKTTDY